MVNRVRFAATLAALSWAVVAACPLAAQTKALRFGSLVDGKGGVIADAIVVVEKDRIVSVGSGARAIPVSAQVVDLRRYTAIPGLIDVHTHMTYFWDEVPGTRPLGQAPRLAAVTVFLAQENARKTLETGVTTVRDMGSSDYNDIAMRDLINAGMMPGPRMFVSGYGLVITRGGRGGGPGTGPLATPTTKRPR